ncbi:hypothetical protein B9Q13_02855 [Candidatus Marsarchaeota G2 archaeon ECH_B_SAG-G16]|uniref:DUF790 family protein n=5 Tax=Candidatus Marsarchaeota TaxID=1978152 RepID=A0A2R6AGZ2_9ARCH|nr:MAG: hypothetical protein B9Q01_03975 [Candidatus Marsarchaeota G1 archaeon OSP_D]PSN85672.1 MAG: hypothetical protein B9Q02_05365 [Candidatus Marsarchaeota G1 archaeon BE_D]PSN88380.1 MAG: hypothetical protein B9Q00_05695 [Candidatus Marsarchaeota G1 archaeon OSP_C]PSO05105.1 MAG: hypothetical protein B9Q13_02855 [Candidatus Marsarchaeota G2 archaeon ECH_B_SAG-G16]
MLPSNLLALRRYRASVEPVYSNYKKEHLALAQLIIDTIKQHTGEKRKNLERALESLEELEFNFKFVRGLCTLALRHCEFKVKEGLPLKPVDIRRIAFERASPFALDSHERSEILQQIAKELGVDEQTVEENLWADREGEEILAHFDEPTPTSLLIEYNLELTETLLFRSKKIQLFELSDWKKALWLVKKRGLMYTAQVVEGSPVLLVEGPVTLTNSQGVYGELFVDLFRDLLHLGFWRLKAEIATTSTVSYTFEFDSTKAKILGFSKAPLKPKRPEFDSEIEKRFYYAFDSLNTGWNLTREGEPLIAEDSIFLPDFVLEKQGFKVYVEIMGFWTKEYLEKKLKKLSALRELPIIVFANRKFSASRAMTEVQGVLFFDKELPLGKLLERLRLYEKALPKAKLEFELSDVVDIANAPKERKEELVHKLLQADYIIVGDKAVSKTLFENIKQALQKEQTLTLHKAQRICDEWGISAAEFLKAAGYTLKWKGLDESSIIVEAPKNS